MGKRRTNHDSYCRKLIAGNRNLLVPWYLINSYLYYIKDRTIIADDTYDMICKQLLDEWDSIEHYHKHLIDKAALAAGTGYMLKEPDYPNIIKGAVDQLLAGNVFDKSE